MVTEEKTEKMLSLIDHLEELRRRLIACTVAVVILSTVSYLYVDKIRAIITRPVGDLVYLGLTEALMTNMKLSLATGLFLAMPLIFHQLWLFVLPALHQGEQRKILFSSVFSFVFFLLGVTFAFFIILPFSTGFFLSFAGESLTPMISFSAYISYSFGLMLGFGLVFLMPAVVMLLARLGLVSADFLAKQRMYATIIIFVLAAIFTPPDVLSQFMMALPMLALYELSIFLARLIRRRDGKLATEPNEGM